MDRFVSATHLSFTYGRQAAIDDVSFEAITGEAVGMIGPNGSGKTTLFRLLAGLVPLQRGELVVGRCSVRTHPDDARRLMGVTFQSPSLDRRLTVDENLTHQGRLYGLTGRTLRQRIDELLERFQLADRRGELVDRLSGGLKRRVEIAKSLLHAPPLLLLDEPTTGVDPAARRDVWQAIHECRQRDGATILITTHLMDEADQCDRVVMLDSGRVVASGSPVELRSAAGTESVTFSGGDLATLAGVLSSRYGTASFHTGTELKVSTSDGRRLLARVLSDSPELVAAASLAPATMDDVFFHFTRRPSSSSST